MNESNDDSAPPGNATTVRNLVMGAFEKYEVRLTAYASKFYGGPSGDLESARDAVQYTFLKLCQQDPSQLKGRVAAWLYTVCRNRILDDLAKQKIRSESNGVFKSPVSNEASPADQCLQNDLVRRVPEILKTVPEAEREVAELWSEGLKPIEIAEVLGRPPGTIRVQLHRAIKSLRAHPEVQTWLERATGQSSDQVNRVSRKQTSNVGK